VRLFGQLKKHVHTSERTFCDVQAAIAHYAASLFMLLTIKGEGRLPPPHYHFNAGTCGGTLMDQSAGLGSAPRDAHALRRLMAFNQISDLSQYTRY